MPNVIPGVDVSNVDLADDETSDAGSTLKEIAELLEQILEVQRQTHWMLSVVLDMEGDEVSWE